VTHIRSFISSMPTSWPEVPRAGSAIYSDEYLDYWADRFVSGFWLYRGVTLMQYLANPQTYERREQPLPLLGRQRRVQGRLLELEARVKRERELRDGEPLDLTSLTWRAERGLETFSRRNGAIFEPLHHHAHPRRGTADFTAKQGLRR
jgi:hypothetical protein